MKKIGFTVLLSVICFAAGCQKKSVPAEHISVVMKKYTITPSEIRLKSGQPVDLDVTTADVQHGFDVPELGIKEAVQPGKTTTISLVAPKKGEYEVHCGIICGPHHDDMTAKLIVE